MKHTNPYSVCANNYILPRENGHNVNSSRKGPTLMADTRKRCTSSSEFAAFWANSSFSSSSMLSFSANNSVNSLARTWTIIVVYSTTNMANGCCLHRNNHVQWLLSTSQQTCPMVVDYIATTMSNGCCLQHNNHVQWLLSTAQQICPMAVSYSATCSMVVVYSETSLNNSCLQHNK